MIPFTRKNNILFGILFLVLMASCSKEHNEDVNDEETIEIPIVVYLVDGEMALSQSYSTHLEKVFDYTKIPYANISISDFNNDDYISDETRVIYINNTEPLSQDAKQSLLEFVSLGGTLVFPSLNEDQKAGFLSGIKPGADYNYDLESKGIHFVRNVLPGLEGKEIYPLKTNIGLKKDAFIESINVLATSITDREMPVIFEHNIGNGRVIHFNTFIEFEKVDRGLLFAPALKGLQGVPFPVANVSTIMIDDFPNPVYDIDAEPIKSEFGLSQAQFVMERWWPDMLKVADKFDLTYTAFPCFNYNTIRQPPFIFTEWDKHKSVINNESVISSEWLVEQVMENEFELGFHGYNHEPLIDTIWNSNTEYIEGALRSARKIWWISRFGPMPKSYVPPSNEIDSVGLKHLANAMPEMEFMSSLYDGELMEGANREFDVDPFEPRFFDFPRISSGYTYNDFKLYNLESLYLFTGIWSHFIHPDDIYQIPDADITTAGDFALRNANRLGWHQSTNGRKGMLEEWNDYLQHMIDLHQSIRFMKVYDGASITRNWRESDYEYVANGDAFDVRKRSTNSWVDENYFWNMFVEKSNEPTLLNELNRMKATYTRTSFFGGTILTINTSEPELKFSNDVSLKGRSSYDLIDAYTMVKNAYDQYAIDRDRSLENVQSSSDAIIVAAPQAVITDSVAWYVANENLKAATDMLKARLETQFELDTVSFDKYALYLAFQERPNEVWDFFEYIYWEVSEDLSLDYVRYYLTKESYPSVELNELWLRRQIEANPGNITLVKEYLRYFYSQEYLSYLDGILFDLMENNDSEESYALYIKYLIDFHPESVIEELKEKNPAQYPALHPMATTITYAFSDAGMKQEALAWAEFSDAIPLRTVLQWWVDLEAYNKMESVYLEYIRTHPLDYELMGYVSNIWYDIGEFEKASLIANKLPEADSTKTRYKGRFNPDVRFFESDVQKFLIAKTPTVFNPDTLKTIMSDLRYYENNSIQYNTDYVVDNFRQSVWNNSMTYNMRTESLNMHSLSVTYTDVSDLNLNAFDINNVPHTLFGLKYRYQTRENTAKPIFYALGGLEQDDVSNTFFTFGAGISHSNERSFKSVGYTFIPVKTGPAISREIYWGQLIGYYETGYAKTFQTSFSPVLSHYTTGALEGSLTGKLFYNAKKGTGSRFSPFAEAFVSGSNDNQPDGNPFWIIDSRFYGGGGLAWTYGRDQSRKLYARLEAGAFYDTYTDNFLRFTGNFSFPIKKFTYVTGQFEFFNQALYYSNGFKFGIKHYFRRRKQYAYKPREYEEWYD